MKRGKEEEEGRGKQKVVLSRDQIFHVCSMALVKNRVCAPLLEKLGDHYKAYMGMLIGVLREKKYLFSLRIFQVCSKSNFGNFGVTKICQFGNLRLYKHLAIFGNLVTVANFGN